MQKTKNLVSQRAPCDVLDIKGWCGRMLLLGGGLTNREPNNQVIYGINNGLATKAIRRVLSAVYFAAQYFQY